MKLKEWYTKNKTKVDGLKYFRFVDNNNKSSGSYSCILYSSRCDFEHIDKFFDYELECEPYLKCNSDGYVVDVLFIFASNQISVLKSKYNK